MGETEEQKQPIQAQLDRKPQTVLKLGCKPGGHTAFCESTTSATDIDARLLRRNPIEPNEVEKRNFLFQIMSGNRTDPRNSITTNTESIPILMGGSRCQRLHKQLRYGYQRR